MLLKSQCIYIVAATFLYILLYRIVTVLADRKLLRRFTGLNHLCHFTNLGFILFNSLARMRGLTRTEALLRIHRKHSVLRLGPNRLSFASVEAIKDIYGTASKCIKGDQYNTATGGGATNLLSVIDREAHAVKRKRLSQAFATKHLLNWEFKVQDKVQRLLKQLDQRAGRKEVIDFRYWSNLFTLEAIMDIAISDSPGFIEAASDVITVKNGSRGSCEEVSLLRCLRAVNKTIEPIVWSPSGYVTLKTLLKLWPPYKELCGAAATWTKFVRDLVSKRTGKIEYNKRSDDLFASLLYKPDGEKLGLEEDELVAELSHLLDAGSDTTSTALTHGLFCLVKHPEVLHRLRSEIQEHAAPEVPLTYDQVRSMRYLKACIDEAMRLQPSISAGLQRKTPSEGVAIGGEWIEGNVFVSVPAYIAHRDETVFSKPETFNPDRWLQEDSRSMQGGILTFNAGARVCIGKNISYLEQSLLLAELVRRYDFELPSADWKISFEEYFNLWPKNLPLKFIQRSYD